MNIGLAWSEARRNLTTGTGSPVVFALVLFVVLAALSVVDARQIVAANQYLAHWQASGASVFVVTLSNSIDGRACDNLANGSNIRHSGAIRTVATGLVLPVLPGAPSPLWEVTPGFADLIEDDHSSSAPTDSAVNPATTGIILSQSLSNLLRRSDGSGITTDKGTAVIAGTYNVAEDGRDQGLAYGALSPVPADGYFDACWVDIWPPSPISAGSIFSVVSPEASISDPPTLWQYNSTFGNDPGLASLYDNRLGRLTAPTACILGMGLAFVFLQRRRIELASSLHAGVSRSTLTLQATFETGIWALLAVVLAAPFAVSAVILGNPSPIASAIADVALVLGFGWLGALAGVWLAVSLTRESLLFAYFKARM